MERKTEAAGPLLAMAIIDGAALTQAHRPPCRASGLAAAYLFPAARFAQFSGSAESIRQPNCPCFEGPSPSGEQA
jgi:hypothetical protein